MNAETFESWRDSFAFMASGSAGLWRLIPNEETLRMFYDDGLSPMEAMKEVCRNGIISPSKRKRPDRRGGKQEAGASLEEDVLRLAAQYERQRALTLRKVDPPTRVVGPGKIVYLKNPFADFVGSWTERGGKVLILEAKHTQEDQLGIGIKGGVSRDQMHNLRVWHHAQAVSAVIWRAGAETFFIPVVILDALCRKHLRKHVKVRDVDRRFRGRDWVRTLREIYI
jgi:hypothetical protein